MEEQIQQNHNPEKPKRRYWKFIAVFLGIMIIAVGGFFVWNKYFSPQAKLNRQTQENYQKYLDWQKNYEKAMTEDTYGGKTPEETLKMFIEALKKEDVETASKYFLLDENGNVDQKWARALQDTKVAGKFQDLANSLLKATPDLETRTSPEDFKFKIYEGGTLKVYINMQLNKYSGVWKIESL